MPDAVTFLPWALFALIAVPIAMLRRPRVRDYTTPPAEQAPLVSIIVPARNEANNIAGCVSTLLDTDYPHFEILIVDDRSTDGTLEIARALDERGGDEVTAIDGEPLPDDWFGKPWACWQGYQRARGELLLFTDADTRHASKLLGRSVGALLEEGAALVSLLPRLVMESFWERVVQPQVWLVLSLRFPDLRRVNRTRSVRDVLANGQFMLMRRDAYEQVGGHEAVKGEVVEDVRLAQRLLDARQRIFLAHAQDMLETRMYDSLAAILEGWTKNLASGSQLVVTPWLRRVAPWLTAAVLIGFWTLPPLVLAYSLFATVGETTYVWAMGATACSIAFWVAIHTLLRIPLGHALLYPLGALVVAAIFVRSALRGEKIYWKGRLYGARSGSGAAEP